MMEVEEVKSRWSEEYDLIYKAIRKADKSIASVVVARDKTSLSLEEFKRIVLSIQCGMSLEEFESAYVPFIKKDIEEVENEWKRLEGLPQKGQRILSVIIYILMGGFILIAINLLLS
jgi:hypothetical protein